MITIVGLSTEIYWTKLIWKFLTPNIIWLSFLLTLETCPVHDFIDNHSTYIQTKKTRGGLSKHIWDYNEGLAIDWDNRITVNKEPNIKSNFYYYFTYLTILYNLE